MAAHKKIQIMVGVGVLVLCSLWLANTVGAQGEVSFIAPRDFRVGEFPRSVAMGDFNSDGHQDLAVAASPVTVLLGQGDGTFVAAPDVGGGDVSIAVGDFNGDGHQDLATANGSFPGTVSILLGRGDGTFQAAPDVGVGFGPRSVAVGDFNGDSHPDLAVVNIFSGTVSILLGEGDGTFIAAPEVVVGVEPVSVAVGDFNSDGHSDLAVANANFPPEDEEPTPGTVSILLGQGDGTFAAAPEVGVGVVPLSVAVGDFNGDGRQDLVVAGSAVSILINTTQVVMNELVTFEPLGSTFHFTPDPTGCPEGFVGTFSFEARLTNTSDSSLTNLVVVVTTLTNGNLLQNADGGPGGVGARLTVPEEDGLADGVLSPDEFVDVPLIICLTQRQPFTFVVDVAGQVD